MSYFRVVKALIAAHMITSCCVSHGQAIDERLFTLEAKVQKNADGATSIHASSPRPLYQALDAVASSLGIVVDYEDPRYVGSEMHGPAGMGRRLNGGSFDATLDLSRATNKASSADAVRVLVGQFNRQSSIHFKVETHDEFSRIDVVPDVTGQAPLFDTKILLDGKERSVSDAIDVILREVSQKTGVCIGRGGFVDNETTAHSIILKTPGLTPARQLLGQALSSTGAEKAWLAAYEPSDGCFYVALSSYNKQVLQSRQ